MATKSKTKETRAAERKSARSQNAKSKSERGAAPNAVELLEQDHREVEDLFEEFEKARDKKRKGELATKICMELTIHARIEEEAFYPRARQATKDDDLIDESLVEHANVKRMVAEIEEMDPGDDLFDAKVRVLSEMVQHHVKEEEEKLFPELKGKMDLEAVGKELARKKENMLAELQE